MICRFYRYVYIYRTWDILVGDESISIYYMIEYYVVQKHGMGSRFFNALVVCNNKMLLRHH